MFRIYVLTFVCFYLSSAQEQIGQTIIGLSSDDRTGTSIDLSSDGTIIAIGSPDFNQSRGYVSVYGYDSNQWILIGSQLNGTEDGDSFGDSVALSSSGDVLAVGSPFNDINGVDSGEVRVFANRGNSWFQLGNSIVGEASRDNFGNDIALSADGTILAIAGLNNSENFPFAGHVKVFQYDGLEWIQLGNEINGKASNTFLGERLDLSSDGQTLAIGVTGTSNFSGAVEVYKLIDNEWIQEGSSILGEAELDQFGYGISISNNGQIVASGGRRNDGVALNSGHARVFINNSGSWEQEGIDLDGSADFDFFGIDLSLSGDGMILAVGGSGFDINGMDSGQVNIYQNIESQWIKKGESINGTEANARSGTEVSLSSNGSILAIGANEFDNGKGQVRVFSVAEILSVIEQDQSSFSVYPNPSQGIMNIEIPNYENLFQVRLFNKLGQLIYQGRNLRINTKNYPSGIYSLVIETEFSSETKKVILH